MNNEIAKLCEKLISIMKQPQTEKSNCISAEIGLFGAAHNYLNANSPKLLEMRNEVYNRAKAIFEQAGLSIDQHEVVIDDKALMTVFENRIIEKEKFDAKCLTVKQWLEDFQNTERLFYVGELAVEGRPDIVWDSGELEVILMTLGENVEAGKEVYRRITEKLNKLIESIEELNRDGLVIRLKDRKGIISSFCWQEDAKSYDDQNL